jgi:hypothetical protein
LFLELRRGIFTAGDSKLERMFYKKNQEFYIFPNPCTSSSKPQKAIKNSLKKHEIYNVLF